MLPYSPNYREFALWPGLVLYSGCLQNTQCMASRVSNEYMFLDWVDISFLSPWRMWCHAHMWIHWKDSILAGSISYGGKETEFLQQETLRNLLWVLLYVFSGNSMCLMSPLPLATWNRSNGAVGAGRSLPSGLQNRNWQSVISQRKKVPLLSLQKGSLPLNNNFKKCVWYVVLRIHFLKVLNVYYFAYILSYTIWQRENMQNITDQIVL